MKIRGEILPETQRFDFEFENLQKFAKMFEQRRKPKISRHIPSTFWYTARAAVTVRIKFVFSKKLYYINYLRQSWSYLII